MGRDDPKHNKEQEREASPHAHETDQDQLGSQSADAVSRRKAIGRELASQLEQANEAFNQCQYEHAERLYRMVLQQACSLHGHNNPGHAAIYANLARVLSAKQQFHEAARHYEQATTLYLDELASTPSKDAWTEIIANLANHAQMERDRGRLEDATRLFREAFYCALRHIGPTHPVTLRLFQARPTFDPNARVPYGTA